MNLFIQPIQYDDFEKLAAEVELPEDPNAWPKEVLDELFKQVPYIADFRPHVVMSKVDAERGYGFGHVEISNQSEAQMGTDPQQMAAAGVRSVRIPVVIKEGKLSPFDLLVNDSSKVLPLTEGRLRQAIFRPQLFDVTSKTPGDQSMIGQLYPPYRQNYGFGGGGLTVPADGMGKTGSVFEEELFKALEETDDGFREAGADDRSIPAPLAGKSMAKKGSLLLAISPSIGEADLNRFWGNISEDHRLQAQFRKNAAATSSALKALSELEPRSLEKQASALPRLIKPSVVQISKHQELGYIVKTASHLYWEPFDESLNRGELVRRFGEKVAMAVDLSGAVTIADGADEATTIKTAEVLPVSDPGFYKVFTTEGDELVGYVIPNLLDTDGQALPLALFTNGSQAAIQGDIFGEPAGEGANLPTGPLTGYGAFFEVTQEGEIRAMVPMTLEASAEMGGEPATLSGETFDGRPVEVSLQPNIQEPTPMDEGKVLIPQHWQWMPLDKAEEVSLAGGDEPQEQEVPEGGAEAPAPAEAPQEGQETPEEPAETKESSWVEIRSDGQTFSLTGIPLEKVAGEHKHFVDIDGAMFLLASLGVEQGHGATKLAHAMTGERPERVKVGRFLKTAAEAQAEARAEAHQLWSRLPNLKRDLTKEAAVLPDASSVDTVLSLGFINPENIMTFVSYLSDMDDTQAKLCELLLAARLGLQDVPPGAVERSVRALEEVIEGLKVIAFQGS